MSFGTIPGLPPLDFRVIHIGIAVAELEPSASQLESLFGYRIASGPFDDPIQKVRVLFLKRDTSDSAEIELICPLTEDSPVRSMLAKQRGGAYHLCLETGNLDAALAHVRHHGCLVVTDPQPAIAFEGRRIAWIYTPARHLFELVEAAPKLRHTVS